MPTRENNLARARSELAEAALAELQPLLDKMTAIITRRLEGLLDEKAVKVVDEFEARARRLNALFASDDPTGEFVLTRQEAADKLKCSTDTIDKLMERGELTRVEIGSRVVVPWTEIRDMVLDAQKRRWKQEQAA